MVSIVDCLLNILYDFELRLGVNSVCRFQCLGNFSPFMVHEAQKCPGLGWSKKYLSAERETRAAIACA